MPGLPSQLEDIPGKYQSPWGDLRLPAGGSNTQDPYAALKTPWWHYLIGPGTALLSDILSNFGGGDGDLEWEKYQREAALRKLMMMTQPAYPASQYQINPQLLKGLNETTITAVLNFLKQRANLGFPQGQQMDTGFIDAFLAQLPGLSGVGTTITPGGRNLRPV